MTFGSLLPGPREANSLVQNESGSAIYEDRILIGNEKELDSLSEQGTAYFYLRKNTEGSWALTLKMREGYLLNLADVN